MATMYYISHKICQPPPSKLKAPRLYIWARGPRPSGWASSGGKIKVVERLYEFSLPSTVVKHQKCAILVKKNYWFSRGGTIGGLTGGRLLFEKQHPEGLHIWGAFYTWRAAYFGLTTLYKIYCPQGFINNICNVFIHKFIQSGQK